MSIVPYFGAAVVSSALRIVENVFLKTSNTAERYLNNEISFEEATDGIVKNIRIYVPLTTTKLICDAIVMSMLGKWIYDVIIYIRSIFKGLINCGFLAFTNGIKSSLNHIFTLIGSCSIGLIRNQFCHLYDKQKQVMSSISMIDFCNISNAIHFSIICTTNGLTKLIQLELMIYWLECMGIVRAVAESNNINFVKYMNKCSPRKMNSNSVNHSSELMEFSWTSRKDSDFIRIVTVPLEHIFHGTERDVIVKREIRSADGRISKTEEAKYRVVIGPGCADGQTFRFIEAGDSDPVNIPADLIVELRTEQHQIYQRSGSDLIYKAKISLDNALRGTSIQVPLIDGRIENCDPHSVINPDTEIIIDQAGLPDPANNGIRGRLIVKFDIIFPDAKKSIESVEVRDRQSVE